MLIEYESKAISIIEAFAHSIKRHSAAVVPGAKTDGHFFLEKYLPLMSQTQKHFAQGNHFFPN